MEHGFKVYFQFPISLSGLTLSQTKEHVYSKFSDQNSSPRDALMPGIYESIMLPEERGY